MDPLHHLLGNCLRSSKCGCLMDYNMKVTKQCARCKGCDAYQLALAEEAIVQKPGGPQCSHAYARENGRCVGCGAVV